MTRRVFVVICAALLSPAARSQAPAPPAPPPLPAAPAGAAGRQPALTLSQAVARALAANPSLSAAREHVSATGAQRITAGLRQNPTLTLLGQGVTLPEYNLNGNPYFYSANVSRLFERGEKRRWRLDSATATTEQTSEQERDQERQIAFATRSAFTQMLQAKAALGIAGENLADYRRTLELSRARLDAGDISRTDFERIDLQLAQFEADEDNARLALLQASEQLQLLFGVERPDPSLEVQGTLDLPTLPATKDELEARALATRPDELAALGGLRAAEANARYAVATGTVDPTVASEFERSGGDNTFGVSVSIPLRIFDRAQGEKARTRFEVNSSRLLVQAARNQAVSDVEQAWSALETAQRLATRYNTHYLDEAARVRDNVEFSYRNGNTTLLDYLDALRSYRAVRLGSINANAQVWLAVHQLSLVTATEVIP
jgi:cobalt-zinc-cadmium efflux system outer membrane protein